MNLRSRIVLALASFVLLLPAACAPGTPSSGPSADTSSAAATPTAPESASPEPSPTPSAGPLTLTSSADAAIPAAPVTFTVENGTVSTASVTTADGTAVEGSYSEKGWVPTSPLEFNTEYKLTAQLSDGSSRDATFKTVNPTGSQANFQVLYLFDGVGVGMPAYVKFSNSVPEAYRAQIEKNAFVTTDPVQEGSWGWLSDTELLWRPKEYWKPGTKVSIHYAWDGVQASDSTFLRKNLDASFSVADTARIIKVDIAGHTTTVEENGEVVQTFPSTTGKEGFTTRSGTKLILEKNESRQMNSETINIPRGSGESYDLNVRYAMRVTWTGEFIHAAPWSVGSQGKENVSHGCVGLSTDNAGWLFARSEVGDVVEFTGSDRQMEPDEGIAVWMFSWDEWKARSAAQS